MINHATLPCDIFVRNTDRLSVGEGLQVLRSGIFGPDAAAALGLDPGKSRHKLWQEKTSDEFPAGKTIATTQRSKFLEPLIRDHFVKNFGLNAVPMNSVLQHPGHLWMLAAPNAVVEEPKQGLGLLELFFSVSSQSGDGERLPDSWQLHVQHNLAVSGLTHAICLVITEGASVRPYFIEKDDELIRRMIEVQRRFWQYVLTGTPPPMNGSPACAELLARKVPVILRQNSWLRPFELDSKLQKYLAAAEAESAVWERKRL